MPETVEPISQGITLGADPEFLFVDSKTGGVLAANRYLQFHSKFGTDGCSTTAEIRPTPSEEPWKVVESIRRLLVRGATSHPQLKAYQWRAGSGYQRKPTGGHIHFGHDQFGDALTRNGLSADYTLRTTRVKTMTRALDFHLAPLVMLMEDETEARFRRIETSYGKLGDARTDVRWGFEYRTLPSFIATPAVSLGVFTLAKVIAESCRAEAYNEARIAEWKTNVRGLSRNEFEACNKTRVHAHFQKRWEAIQRMPTAEPYWEVLKAFRWMLKNGALFSQMPDMKKAWGLKYEEPAEVPLVSPDNAWQLAGGQANALSG